MRKTRSWRSFNDARDFVHQLGLKSVKQWKVYCKSGEKPDDIPSNPHEVYISDYRGMGDWLGTGTIAPRDRVYRPFAEARAFVHQLGLKSLKEWHVYCKSGERPDDIPSNPYKKYGIEFKGWGDWLGTGTIAPRDRVYRPFAEARAFVHQLGLKSRSQWEAYSKSGNKPDDIPTAPWDVYRSEFKGWGDWLGTGVTAARDRIFLSFAEARAFVHQLGLKSLKEWQAYCVSGEKPVNIPTDPRAVYRSDFRGMGDWLGTGTRAPRDRVYRPFVEARAFVRRLELKNLEDWEAYCRSGKKPDDIPASPQWIYKDKFKGVGDWLGTGTIATFNHTFLPFVEARAFVHTLGLRRQYEWKMYCKSGKKPDNIPSNPNRTYQAEFISFGDWLGTGHVGNRNRVYLPFAEARAFAHQLGLKGKDEWMAYCKSGKKPENIPTNPPTVYASEYRGWGDWLGSVNKWSRSALLALLHDLRPHLDKLEERELYAILQQGGALPALRITLGKASSVRVLKDLKENGGGELEEALKVISSTELTPSNGDELVDDVVTDEGNLSMFDGIHVFEHEEMRSISYDESKTYMETLPTQEVEAGLPILATRESLKVVDVLAQMSYGLDENAAEYLVANRVSALWERYINEGRATVDDLLTKNGGYWYTMIKRRFLAEVKAVEQLVIPEGWSFPERPNAMQLRTAWAVREKGRAGNWSGVGAGKTLSAVLTSHVIDARVTLVVANNTTVKKGWPEEIRRAYHDSVVYLEVVDGLVLDRDRYNYIVLNYEKFQGPGRDHLVHLLLRLGLDFIVFDEVQFVKQRDDRASKRRKALESLVYEAGKRNPHLKVLGMSATPVINNLLEAKKLLEIVTGFEFPELITMATVNNALTMHRYLMLYGFRYRPRYEQEMHTVPIIIPRNDLFETLWKAQNSVLHVEQVLIHPKLEGLRPFFQKGTIVYTHYVKGIVELVRNFLEGVGLTVGLYTDRDKSGLEAFLKGSVDILLGTRPIGTGLDGLQKVCNRIVMLCLPWTGAEYEQIIGRIRRQGYSFGEVEIIVPQVTLDYEGHTWSWDQGRMACIQYKRDLSDCVLDGRIPESVRVSQDALLQLSREALERWIARIDVNSLLAIERQRLTVPLPPDLRYAVQVRHGDFTVLNKQWNTSHSLTTHQRLQRDPSEWYLYHTLYREVCQQWPEQPFERIAQRIRMRPDWVIGDFGCGECLLKKVLPNSHVIGIDHVACEEQVVACDMACTPLEDNFLDVAVFSLSLMGTNWAEYLKEAYRTLKPYGHLFIAEPHRRWQESIEILKHTITAQGFCLLGDVEQRYEFIYLTAIKM